jgi:hypothetical protein
MVVLVLLLTNCIYTTVERFRSPETLLVLAIA